MINPDWRKLFASHILERGEDYAYSGAVENLQVAEDKIKAVVSGTQYYRVEIDMKDGMPQAMYCSCPYADGSNNCKHMAAVLYEAEGGIDDDFDDEDDEDREDYDDESKGKGVSSQPKPTRTPSGASDITELLRSLSQDELVDFIKELAGNNGEIANLIRVRFSRSISARDMRAFKREADNIFYSHADRGFIDYHEAMAFESDISRFLKEKVGNLVDNGLYPEAFELSMYVFVKLSSTDIDDDGEIQMISETCYDLWKRIVSSCSKEEYDRIQDWFRSHSDDDTVVDYLENVLQEFLQNELADEDDIREQIRELDERIKAAEDNTRCPTVYSSVSYDVPAVFRRMELMKRIGASDDEVEAYRYSQRRFSVVREQYMREAEEAGNKNTLIALLEESKELDAASKHKVHSYSQRLADLYHGEGFTEKELKERFQSFVAYHGSVDDFLSVKKLCTEAGWPEYRDRMIDAVDSREMKEELYAEECLTEPLYAMVFEKPDIPQLDKFGFLLADEHSEEILEIYRKYVESIAETVRNRSGYQRLTSYLSRMLRYEGGPELVKKLASRWSAEYPTRRVMLQELSRFL